MTRFESLGHRIVPWAVAAGILLMAWLGSVTG